jgi:outer membrane receptor for Fe3+-dicitrate
VPASVNVVDVNQIERIWSPNITDALQKYVPGIIVNEVTGNPFQPNVQFRGFVASPVAGTPQGMRFIRMESASTKRSATP